MPNKVYTTLFSGNHPVLLAKQMMWEQVDSSFWGKWAKFNGPNRKPLTASQKGAVLKNTPIVIQNKLQGVQGDVMKIPMHRYLRNKPKVSGEQLIGFEERAKINFCQVPIDMFRHAEEPYDSSIMKQVTKDIDLINMAKPALETHYSQVEEFLGLLYAIYYGFSWYTLRGKSFFGDTRFSVRSHPHIYVANRGKVGGSPGTSAYETNIYTELHAIASDTTAVFNTAFLRGLRASPQLSRIKPLYTKDGNEFWVIVAHSWQIADLKADSNFKAVQQAAMVQQMAKDNPYLVGAKYFYEGFAIFEHSNSVWPVTEKTTADGVIYGPFTSGFNFDTDGNMDYFRQWESYDGGTTANKHFGAILFGDNFMYRGVVKYPQFIKEHYDYDEVLGVGYRVLDGYSRGDFWNMDDGTTGQHIVNDGSLLLITYATQPSF
jgi:hypothetical protein